jgi:hypothetical protein
MRLFWRFTSGESQGAAVHCPASSLAMASPSKTSAGGRAQPSRRGSRPPTNMVQLNGWNLRLERLVSDRYDQDAL